VEKAAPVVRDPKPEGELLRKTQAEPPVEPKKEDEFKKASVPYKPNVAAPRT
jgi:hypothetical protein